MVGVEESTEEVAQEDKDTPPHPWSLTEAPKQGLSFPCSQREKISMRKRHKDRKTALISVPVGLGFRAGQSRSCKSTGVLLSQSQQQCGCAGGWASNISAAIAQAN